MSTKRNHHDFTRIAQALNVCPIEAAKHVLDAARSGKQLPRWMRRAARSITRRASAS